MTDLFSDVGRLRLPSAAAPPRREPPTTPAPVKGAGAWLPWPVVERVVRLRLRPASRWQVLALLLCTSCRYGRKEARLTGAEIAAKTGLSERTVKAAIQDLIRRGLVRRLGRYRKLVVTLIEPPSDPPPEVELPVRGG